MLSGKAGKSTLAQWTFHTCCGAVLLQGLRCVRVVVDWAHKLDRSVLEAVVVNKESFVEVHVAIHLLRIVLIEQPDIPVEIAFVKDAMKALAWPDVTVTVSFDLRCVADALVSDWLMRLDLNIVISVDFVFYRAEALKAGLGFHLYQSCKISKFVLATDF